jgi:NADPH2:quinone reductase
MNNAIVVHQTGGPDVMQYEPVDLPAIGPGQVKLRQEFAGFNMIDTYRRKGLYPVAVPFIPGSEAAAVVEETADDVTTLKPGDRVIYTTADVGAYTEQRVMDAVNLIRIPDQITNEVAAASFLKGLTVWYLIKKTWSLKAGDTILVYAAAGGVGTMLSQWAKSISARVIGVVGSEAKAQVARDNGCDAVINYVDNGVHIADEVRSLNDGKGVDVVYDSIGLETFSASLDSLRPRGLMVSYGNATGLVPPVDVMDLMRKGSLFLTRPTLFHHIDTRESLEEGASALFDVIISGIVKVHINQRYALKDAVEAHRAVESRQTTGTTILECI